MTDRPRTPGRRIALLAWGGLCASTIVRTPARGDDAVRWQSRLVGGLADWGPLRDSWGADNRQWVTDPAVAGQVLRVHLQAGSIDPGSMRRRGRSPSGTGFKAAVLRPACDAARLSYRVRFAPGFDFVLGGKLPGLFGGSGPSGGQVPDGHNGCSVRLMWRERGVAEAYAYLPGTGQHGRSLLRGAFAFAPGRWHRVQLTAWLNTPGLADGRVALQVDDGAAAVAEGLRMRDHASLRLDGVFVDVFFGGNDDRWAARADTHVDLADFAIHALAS